MGTGRPHCRILSGANNVSRRRCAPLFFGCFCVLAALAYYNDGFYFSALGKMSSNSKTTRQQKYRGEQFWKKGTTQGVKTLYETPFARFQIHQVLLEDGKTVVNDWLWYDEANNVNVLVEKANGNDSAPTYLVFHQKKYAIDGKTYAVLGGLIEPGEEPQLAAARELKEEMGMESTEWIEMGSYRAAANRGGGMTFTFLARKAKKISTGVKRQQGQQSKLFAEGESERQDIVELSREQLVEALLAGKFREIKWTATVALALLKTQLQQSP
jgi:ADP-ribose pyrophosphatase